MDNIQKELLKQVADIHEVPTGAYSLRINGKMHGKNSTENIEIVAKDDKSGIDIYIKPGTKNESIHMPVLLSQSGLKETVYNDFHVGEDCDVVIVAGCGIHNGGSSDSEHSGIHSFYLAKNAKLKYIEKHYGAGDGNGKNVMNPTTCVELAENAYMEMETAQIKGVDSTDRTTRAVLGDNAVLKVSEKIMTHGEQYAKTTFEVDMNGEDCGAHVISRSVACDNSKQLFVSLINGN
ncbi:MAG: SufD family Fe-S cluster assembly protein, partial [Clostridia bacterium]|nr:SufD family Fe-S cluster assembly protein [Clostridia bacterium]